MSPRVSIAIVTFQHGDFIATAVQSALEQAHDNLHVVVADDGSTDGTRDVLADLEREYRDRMVLVMNQGARSVARNVNRALVECDGDFVILFDGDDYLLPGKVQAQLDAFDDNPKVNVCFHAAESFDSRTGDSLGLVGNPGSVTHVTAADFVASGNFMPLCSVMMRRAAMPARGVHPDLRFVADWILLIETTYGGTLQGIDGVYARYRRHRGAISSLQNLQSPVWQDALKTLDIVEDEYPDLARYCDEGRAYVLSWEVSRRLQGGHEPRHALPLLLRALRYRPLRRDIWRRTLGLSLRSVQARLSSHRGTG